MRPQPAARRGEVDEALSALLAEHDRCWRELDFEGISALWDESDPDCTYCGDEYARPQVGWAELQAHWARLGARIKAAAATSTLVHSRVIAPGIALAVVLAEWELLTIEGDAPQRGHNWVTILLRERPPAWKLFHYVETPTHVASLSEVTDGR